MVENRGEETIFSADYKRETPIKENLVEIIGEGNPDKLTSLKFMNVPEKQDSSVAESISKDHILSQKPFEDADTNSYGCIQDSDIVKILDMDGRMNNSKLNFNSPTQNTVDNNAFYLWDEREMKMDEGASLEKKLVENKDKLQGMNCKVSDLDYSIHASSPRRLHGNMFEDLQPKKAITNKDTLMELMNDSRNIENSNRINFQQEKGYDTFNSERLDKLEPVKKSKENISYGDIKFLDEILGHSGTKGIINKDNMAESESKIKMIFEENTGNYGLKDKSRSTDQFSQKESIPKNTNWLDGILDISYQCDKKQVNYRDSSGQNISGIKNTLLGSDVSAINQHLSKNVSLDELLIDNKNEYSGFDRNMSNFIHEQAKPKVNRDLFNFASNTSNSIFNKRNGYQYSYNNVPNRNIYSGNTMEYQNPLSQGYQYYNQPRDIANNSVPLIKKFSDYNNYENTGIVSQKLQQIHNTENVLFRNPGVRQNTGFVSLGYSKTKRRRRLNSKTWNFSGSCDLPPSKLSSMDYIFGKSCAEHSSPRSLSLVLNSSDKGCTENKRAIENFIQKIKTIDFSNITFLELKNLMKDFGLNPSGKKQEMIDRIHKTITELGGLTEEVPEEKSKDLSEIKKETDASFEGFFF